MRTFKMLACAITAVIAISSCSANTDQEEHTANIVQELPGVYSQWAVADAYDTSTRGTTVFMSGLCYMRAVHMLDVDFYNRLRHMILDYTGEEVYENNTWALVPYQTTQTKIHESSTPSIVRDFNAAFNTGDFYVFTVDQSNTVQYALYDMPADNPAVSTGTWSGWYKLSQLNQYKNVSVFGKANNYVMLLVRASDNLPMYSTSTNLTTWSTPAALDPIPGGNNGVQMTGAMWNLGTDIFVEAGGKYYTSRKNTCVVPGPICWNGWTQLPTISSWGANLTPMLTAVPMTKPFDNFDVQLCLYAAHRPKNFSFSDLGPSYIYERCTIDDTFENFHSLGTYSTEEMFLNEQIPATYTNQIACEYDATTWIYEVVEGPRTQRYRRVKLATYPEDSR